MSSQYPLPPPHPHPTPHKEELPSLRGHHLHAAVCFPEPKITTLFSQEIEKPQNVLFKRSGIRSFTGSPCQLGVRNSQVPRNTCLGTVVTGLCSASLQRGSQMPRSAPTCPKAALSHFLSVHLTSHRLTFKRVCCRGCVGTGPTVLSNKDQELFTLYPPTSSSPGNPWLTHFLASPQR